MAQLSTQTCTVLNGSYLVGFGLVTGHAQRRPASNQRQVAGPASATMSRAKVMAVSVALMAFPVLIAAAPLTVTIPLGVTFVTGLAASGLVPMVERRLARRKASPQ